MARRGWTKKTIDQVRENIRYQLDQQDCDSDKRLRFILERAAAPIKEGTQEQEVQAYTWIIYALLHHQRHGGLRLTQVQRLYDKAIDLLRLKKVNLTSSRLNYLYGDLRLLMSQIYRASGQHFEAAWEQQLAARLYRDHVERGPGFQAMGLAVRALRRGDAPVAIVHYERAIQSNPDLAQRAMLGRVKALRLAGRWKDAEVASAALAEQQLENGLLTEFAWEQLCISGSKQHSIEPMLLACGSGGSHHSAIYILEAYLWARAAQRMAGPDRLLALETLRKKFTGIASIAPLYQTVVAIELTYDRDYPFEYRLDRLGKTLNQRHRFLSIDTEMLLIAAAIRWLIRAHAFGLAGVLRQEYAGYCWRLTGQAQKDPLGLLDDVLSRQDLMATG